MCSGPAILVVGDGSFGQFPESMKEFYKRKGGGHKNQLTYQLELEMGFE